MPKLTSVTLAAVGAAAMAGTASAYKLSFWGNTDCSGDSSASGFSSSGTCKEIEDTTSSFKVTCDSAASTSAWSYIVYSDENCGTQNAVYNGTDSNTCTSLGATAVKVDCGASACFAASAQVQLEGGARVALSQLNPGDRVLSADEEGNLFYDKVFRVTHWEQGIRGDHVRVVTDQGQQLELTPNHYVHSGTLDNKSLKLAGELQEGDELFVVGADGKLTAAHVASAEIVEAEGLFNVHTLSGRVVVNDIVASHFSTESKWGESGEGNDRATQWYKIVDALSSVFGAENARED